jgi:SAM-dependent methyltransferase
MHRELAHADAPVSQLPPHSEARKTVASYCRSVRDEGSRARRSRLRLAKRVLQCEKGVMRDQLYSILDRPWVYALAQKLLAPGAEHALTHHIREMLSSLPIGDPLLDLGCGPQSWLSCLGLTPVGLDLNSSYMKAYQNLGGSGIVATAAKVPFRDESFVGVWSIGLLHHLPDDIARAALTEAIRVCRPCGYVVILDAVVPPSVWRRPLAAFIRRLDRGAFMRSEEAIWALLPGRDKWNSTRFTYAATGLEMLACVLRKSNG